MPLIQGPGKLLTAEQSARLSMLDQLGRERMIEVIVAGLRAVTDNNGRGKVGGSCPFLFYSRPFR